MCQSHLTKADLETPIGKELLGLCVEFTANGELNREKVIRLRRWLRENQAQDMLAIRYLCKTMRRITSDGVIDRDELMELYAAVEHVMHTAHRAIHQARSEKEVERRLHEADQELKRPTQDGFQTLKNDGRLYHRIVRVAGVSYPNDNGTSRQDILKQCTVLEPLSLFPDVLNPFDANAIKICRETGEQIGDVPAWLAEEIMEGKNDLDHALVPFLLRFLPPTDKHPFLRADFMLFFIDQEVDGEIADKYIRHTLEKSIKNSDTMMQM